MQRLGTIAFLAIPLMMGCGSGSGDDADSGVGSPDGSPSTGDAGVGIDGGPAPDGAVATPDGGSFPGVAATDRRVAAGRDFSIGLDGSGGLWAWGENISGKVGSGDGSFSWPFTGNVFAPVPPAAMEGKTFTTVAAGRDHTLALESGGRVWTWGANDYGQIGDDNMGTNALAPIELTSVSGATVVGAGTHHSLVIDGSGVLWAWGRNDNRQLGDGTNVVRTSPVQVDASALPSGVAFAAAGGGDGFSVGLADDGTVWVWGSGADQLGLGGTSTSATPTRLSALSNIVAIAAGANHALALASDGAIWAWGSGSAGQLGDGNTSASNTPVRVATIASAGTVAAVRAGPARSYAVLDNGEVFGWGDGVTTPTQIAFTDAIADVAAGTNHAIAVTTGGGFRAWGGGNAGQLGHGSTSDSTQVVSTRGPSGATPVMVVGGGEYSFVHMSNGETWTFGRGQTAQGGETGGTSPVLSTALASIDVAQIASGSRHSLVLDTSGAVWAIGVNDDGQLGDGSTTASSVPIPVTFPGLGSGTTMTWVGVSSYSSAALDSNGGIWTWGRNNYGQLGDGTITERHQPVRVLASPGGVPVSGFVEVSIGLSHMIARDGSGHAWTWGLDTSGRGGNTPMQTCASGNGCNTTPQRVCDVGTDATTCSGLSSWLGPVDQVLAGSDFSLVRRSGQVLAFGRRASGQIGNGVCTSPGGQLVPRVVDNSTGSGPLTGITAIYTHRTSVYALDSSGTLWGWGDNTYAQMATDPANTVCSSRSARTRPAVITGLVGTIVELAAGDFHALARMSDGTVYSWGGNAEGQLGHQARDFVSGRGRMSFSVRPITRLPR